MRVNLRGHFSVTDSAGTNVAPRGQKERALIALLALSPEQHRTRKWIQERLWSDRFPEQASASLRRAIYSIRKQIDDKSAFLQSDRNSVWLDKTVDINSAEPKSARLLEDIHVNDSAFADWAEQIRYKIDGEVRTAGSRTRAFLRNDVINVSCFSRQTDPDLQLLSRIMADTLAVRLREYGPVDVDIYESTEATDQSSENCFWNLELEFAVSGKQWLAHLRAFSTNPRRFLWAGQFHHPLDVVAIAKSNDLSDFVNRAVVSILAADHGTMNNYSGFQAATEKVFLGNRDQLGMADRIFEHLEAQDPNGVARAWRSYIGLTQALEFGEKSEDLVERTLEFAADAQRRGYGNPMVMALLAQVQMKIGGDVEKGQFLADQAQKFSDRNPYALHAQSQACVLRGEYADGYDFAVAGRAVSASMPNSYCWDFQACLAALGVGKRNEAYNLARQAHLKMPNYRPALRYLTALSYLAGRPESADKWSNRLLDLEPGFSNEKLLDASYPVDTLRTLGLQEELASMRHNQPRPN